MLVPKREVREPLPLAQGPPEVSGRARMDTQLGLTTEHVFLTWVFPADGSQPGGLVRKRRKPGRPGEDPELTQEGTHRGIPEPEEICSGGPLVPSLNQEAK